MQDKTKTLLLRICLTQHLTVCVTSKYAWSSNNNECTKTDVSVIVFTPAPTPTCAHSLQNETQTTQTHTKCYFMDKYR